LLRPRPGIAALALALLVTGAPIAASLVRAADVVVRPGDTLTAISRRTGVPIDRLVSLNEIANPSRIYAGQVLRTEAAASSSAPTPAAPPASTGTGRIHVVRSGEHLTGIARHYGVTISTIASANRVTDPSRIFAGQRLMIPGTTPTASAAAARPAAPTPPAAPAPPAAPRLHVVRPGEHLTGIARKYGLTIAAVVAANRIADPSRIYAGQRLAIPTAMPPKTAKPAAPKSPSMPASMATLVAKRDAVRRVIVEEAKRYDVPAPFALAVAWQESGWQQGVVSHANAIGVMQLIPATAAWVGEAMLGSPVDPRDLRQNVRAGVRLLAHYLDRYDGNRDLVLAAYYQGQTAADRHGVYAVTRPYIASIRVLERLFGG
jgi:N-acetylmuramoyl-L-alanine amidase